MSSRDGVVFEVYGASVVEPLLNAVGVVEPFDVVEQGGAQRRSGRPVAALMDPGEFAFDGGEERLDGGVVVAAADGTERLVELEFGQSARERQRGVDGAAIGVMHQAVIRSSPLEGHQQRSTDEVSVDGIA